MNARDPLKLVEAIAQDLEGSLGRKLVARVIGKHRAAIEALVAEGYPAEAIFDRILSLTQSSVPTVTKGALRQALYRARKAAHPDQDRTKPVSPTEIPRASPPAGMSGPAVPENGTAQTGRHASPAADKRRHAIRKRAALLKSD